MKIEITGIGSQELLGIINSFPDGEVVCEGNKAIWETKSTKAQYTPQNIQQPAQQPMAKKNSSMIDFNKARQSLFDAFS